MRELIAPLIVMPLIGVLVIVIFAIAKIQNEPKPDGPCAGMVEGMVLEDKLGTRVMVTYVSKYERIDVLYANGQKQTLACSLFAPQHPLGNE